MIKYESFISNLLIILAKFVTVRRVTVVVVVKKSLCFNILPGYGDTAKLNINFHDFLAINLHLLIGNVILP